MMKNKLRCVGYSTGLGALGVVSAGCVAAAILSVMGLAAHGAGYLLNNNLDNYSLKNRFETAYSFKTPETHKYYYVNGGDVEKYAMTPYGTYGTMGAFMALSGAFGALIGRLAAKDKEQEIIKSQQQKTR